MSLNALNRVLTPRGYAIKKSSLTSDQTQDLRARLTMTPQVPDKFQKGMSTFPIYYESASRFYTPRYWARKTFGEPEADVVPEGKPLPETLHFKGTPYPYQEQIINTFINNGGNGLICVPCGRGKTFMALNIAVRLGHRFLIVVDKEFLMNQWKGEIENYIHGARVGILQGSTCQIGDDIVYDKPFTLPQLKEMAKEAGLKVGGTKAEILERLSVAGVDTTPKSHKVEYDVTICMIQTICRQEFPEGFFSEYGFTIFDECHHLGASYFSKALLKIQTKWMLGLSATPDRDDGLTKVFEYYLGEPVYQEKSREPDPTVIVKAVWFKSDDDTYNNLPLDWKGEVCGPKLLNQIVDFAPRNQKMLDILYEYTVDPNRYILILSDRISQLEWFENNIDKKFTVGYYIGGMKQDILDKNAAECQILLATYQMASEAFNVKRLNTVILATPRKKVEQSTGRILRTRIEDRKVPPCIIDIIDSHDTYIRRWYQRKAYYKQCKYTFEHINRATKEPKQKVEENEHGSLFKF